MSKLIQESKASGKKLFLQFGGQGSPYLKEVTKLYKEEPLLKEFFEVVFSTLNELEPLFSKKDQRFEHGFDLKTWMENPESAPSEDYQARASVSVVMIFITQIAQYYLFTLKGYSSSELASVVGGATGHSQGIISATFAALNLSGNEFLEALKNFTKFIFYLGYHAQGSFMEFEYSQEVIEGNARNGDKSPSPMVAVIGYTKEELEQKVSKFNTELNLQGKDVIYISLYNTPDSMILSGRPESLLKFRSMYKAEMDETKKKFVYLKTSAPFHCPFTQDSWNGFLSDFQAGKFLFPYKNSDLKFPVFSIFDGEDYRTKNVDLLEVLYKDVVIRSLYWDKALGVLFTNPNIGYVVDFGPGVVSSRLTSGQLAPRGINIPVYCTANPKDLKNLFE
jgi:malonyl CoA-acyl carrier protein transacylase